MTSKMKISGLALACSLITSQAFAFGGFATIVINPTAHTYGSAHGQNSREESEATALSKCGATCANVDVATLESGKSGLIEAYTTDGWVAVSVSHAGTVAVSDPTANADESTAEFSAYNKCGGAANNCYIYRSTSSFINSADVDGVRPQ